MTKKLVFTVTLSEEEDKYDGYKYYEYDGVTLSGDITADEWSGIAEGWAQSDQYWVDICNDIVNADFKEGSE